MIKSAIIGCSARAVEHAAAYEQLPEATVWALCDSNAERLASFPGAVPVERRFATVTALLANGIPDLVHLITPPTVRLSMIHPLVDAGVKAIIVEKPLSCSLTEADQIVNLCQRHGVRLAVNHQLTFMPSYRRAKQHLADGFIGKLERIRISCNGSPYEQGTHMLDLADFFLDHVKPERVIGQIAGAEKLQASHPSPEYMIGRILFDGGAAVDLVFGDIADPRVAPEFFWVGCRIEIVGSKGIIDHRLSHGYRIMTEDKALVIDSAFDYGRENAQAQLAFTKAFIQKLLSRQPVDVTAGERALQPIALMEALIESADRHELVKFPVRASGDMGAHLKNILSK
ncbi:Gfo/Idh/MocA family oxidoreductase [Horticoccus luteus]|uniref:Gfo/Idh/MocA family oxidoreductase n=1 Tax=Horticoccus luteus TaxID=2862869 RepID=A0A8F9TYF6_9BACT|nr:Gfo/Idh/MocA family oxidoreductase [Horticoccus luteus]QYM80450.1 Gfo/Idh/MocA family oxidoreductase [Horticoccus luteus]